MIVEILRFTRKDATELYPDPGANAEALKECMKLSTNVWKGVIDGEIASVWGVITPTFLSNQCYLWLTTTDIADKHQFVLVRYSQLVVQNLLTTYERIVGHVMIDQPRSKKWLKWLGAEFNPAESDGKKMPFVIRRKTLHG